jgi:hypothetical protein
MSRRDIQRLTSAVNGLADGLRSVKLSGIRIRNNIAVGADEHLNGGWLENVAYWRNRPTIAVSLDKYTLARQRAFWVGFRSSVSRPIAQLYENLPRELAPRRTLENGDAEQSKDIWVLKRPLPQSLFNRPIAEHYKGDKKFFGYYDSAENLDVDRAVNFISSIILAQEDGADEESVDIRLISRNTDLTETENEQLVRARRGQGNFRKGLEAIWKSGCPVTGYTIPELLRASHIMPWREADNRQRLDPYNGILLSANVDALFDKYLISFTNEGKLIISDLLPPEEIRRLELSKGASIPLLDAHKAYLKHHQLRFEHKRSRRSTG